MKNHSVEFFRFFFMLFICLAHFPGRTVINLNHPYLAVDFFFIVSGLFIYKSSVKERPLSTFDFSLKKVKRFYPKLVIGCVLVTLLQPTWLHNVGSLEQIVNEWRPVVNELCFVMDIGIFGPGKNPPVWYLTTLVLGGAFLYSLLIYDRKLSLRLFFPMVLVILTYIFHQGDSVSIWGVNGWIYRPLLRGVAGMGIGVFCGYFLQYYKDRFSVRFVNITSVLSLCAILFIMFAKNTLDAYIFFFFLFLIVSCFQEESLIYKFTSAKIWDSFGAISFDMFILHCPIIDAIVVINRCLKIPYSVAFLIGYLLICVVSGFIFNKACAAIFKNRKPAYFG